MTRKTQKEYNKRYYEKHKERLNAEQRAYYRQTKELRTAKRAGITRKSRIKNHDKIQAWNKAYYARHKEDYYRRSVSSRYGLSPEEYTDLVTQCGVGCNICGKSFTETKHCIDHNHTTDKVRGLLCRSCNVFLGWFEKNRNPVIAYLECYIEP